MPSTRNISSLFPRPSPTAGKEIQVTDRDLNHPQKAAFKSIVDKFTPVDWKQQCRANIGAPAFPSKPEPAGH